MSRAAMTIWTDADRKRLEKWANGLPKGTRVEVKAPRRTVDQNNLLWSLLTQIAVQVVWYGTRLSAEDWKDVLTASFRKARVVPGIDEGTYVPLGLRTSDMSKEEMTELIELAFAFGAQQGVEFRENAS